MRMARVKNWAEFQHYKDRSPPWIKLHRALLDDFDFQCLPVASRALAPMLWLLAAEHADGLVCVEPERISFRLRMTSKEASQAVTPLIEKGFLIVASNVLADCKQVACPETETETETETENTGTADAGAGQGATRAENCPQAQIIALYHELLPELPPAREWPDANAAQLRARWRSAPDRQSLDWWRKFFGYVKDSDFLMGRKTDFQASLGWLVKASNFAKVVNGNYENRGNA